MSNTNQTKPMKYNPINGTEELSHTDALEFRKYHGRIAWLFNPWTGVKRDPRDIGTDVLGYLIS